LLLGSCLLLKQLDMLTAERIWMVILISHTARLALTYAAFHAGRWQGIKVEVEA